MDEPVFKNSILSRLPENEIKQVLPTIRLIPMTFRQMGFEPYTPITNVDFPDSGLYSMVTLVDNEDEVEVATIGWEGMVGLPLVMGSNTTSQRVFCQMPGQTWRMSAEDFAQLLTKLPRFNYLCRRYCLFVLEQAGHNSGCNRAHQIFERCAKWLLLSHDRAQAETFELTQEFLAEMIGVRRQGVNLAIGTLVAANLIKHERGRITVLNRPGLEDVSCECYKQIRRSLDDFLRC